MRRTTICLAVLIQGCATTQGGWERPDATDQMWHMDRGSCIVQMESVPFAGAYQKANVFAGCMQSKGWYWVERPVK